MVTEATEIIESMTTKPLTSHEKYLVLGMMFKDRIFHENEAYISVNRVYDFLDLDDDGREDHDVMISTEDAETLIDRIDVESVKIKICGVYYQMISIHWLLEYFDISHM